jgi:hypothetical protein
MLALVEVGRLAAEFAAKYKAELLGLALFIMSFAWAGGCAKNADLQAKLDACEAKPPVVQTVTVAAKAVQTVRVVYKDGSPCADVEASNDNSFSVGVTQTAGGSSAPASNMGPLTLGLGAAYYQGLWHPAAGVGVAFGKVAGYEVGASVDVAAAAFDSTPGLEPMGMVKMTVRR